MHRGRSSNLPHCTEMCQPMNDFYVGYQPKARSFSRFVGVVIGLVAGVSVALVLVLGQMRSQFGV